MNTEERRKDRTLNRILIPLSFIPPAFVPFMAQGVNEWYHIAFIVYGVIGAWFGTLIVGQLVYLPLVHFYIDEGNSLWKSFVLYARWLVALIVVLMILSSAFSRHPDDRLFYSSMETKAIKEALG